MRRITILLFVILTSINAFGQRRITGRAIDSDTKSPIKNLRVYIEQSQVETFTNHIGFFELSIEDSIKIITVDHVSYGTSEINIPTQDKFMFTLTKQEIEIPIVDIRSFSEYPLDNFPLDTMLNQNISTRSIDFVGGYNGLLRYIGENVQIGESVEDKFICLFPDTTYWIESYFIVDKYGKVNDISISGDTLFGMGNIFMNALSKAKWEPALQNGDACEQKVKMKIYYGNWAYMIIDNPASFPGSKTPSDLTAFNKYIADNLVYPKEAKIKGIKGSVFVQFVINKRGEVVKDKIKIVQGLGYGLDEEAKRLISNSPTWNPGKQRGVNVYQSIVLPVRF
jgi:TonB family protein